MNTENKSTTLYYHEGSSDKVYQASIEPAGHLFVVNFAYGRRGSTLNLGTKTNVPVVYESALSIYEKLVREKKAKGYTEGPNGTPYSGATEEYSGIEPQLLNAIEDDRIEPYLTSRQWVMQEKFDGKRLLLLKQGNAVRGINRKGLFIGVPETIRKDALRAEGDFLMDGEAVGDTYRAFDLLSVRGEDIRSLGYGWRLDGLLTLTGELGGGSIRLVAQSVEEADKRDQLQLFRERKAEGVVFKHVHAPYTAGRPNSGGPQLKYKFYATASFIVAALNQQRSVLLAVLDDGKEVPAGNVTVPPNQEVPAVHDIVEVRYLYAFPESRAVYQPVYLGKRDDVSVSECTAGQLKFKSPVPEA